MIQLKYIGENRPFGMIVEAEDVVVENMLKTGEWEVLNGSPQETQKSQKQKKEEEEVLGDSIGD